MDLGWRVSKRAAYPRLLLLNRVEVPSKKNGRALSILTGIAGGLRKQLGTWEFQFSIIPTELHRGGIITLVMTLATNTRSSVRGDNCR